MASSLRRYLRRNASAVLLLLMGLLATYVAQAYARRTVRASEERRFDVAVDEMVDGLDDRMSAYVATLFAVRGLFEASDFVTRDEFRKFVSSLEVGRRYPGIRGIGFAERVPVEQLERHERRVQADGAPGYHVWPEASGRSELFPITYLEPQDWRNLRAMGFDMSSQPVRREAMEKARDTGLPVMSGKVELVQETSLDRQAGFLIYVPVYKTQETPPPPDRAALLTGFVYSPFRVEDLLDAVLKSYPTRAVYFELYDGNDISPQTLLFDGGRDLRLSEHGPQTKHEKRTRLEIAGHVWTLCFHAAPGFQDDAARHAPLYVLWLGGVTSVLLFAVARYQIRGRESAERAQQRAGFLAAVGSALASSVGLERTLWAVADLCSRRLGDLAWIDVIDPEQGPVRIAAAHSESLSAEKAARLSQLLSPPYPPGSPPAHALGTGRVERVVELQSALDSGAALPTREALAAGDVRSVLSVPLQARGVTLGVMTVLVHGRWRPFTADDEILALDVARLVGATVDNARLLQKAQEAIRLRDEFLSIASHELRTPLTSLQLQVQSLKREASLTTGPLSAERVLRVLGTTERQSVRLAKLIANLLDISRIVNGRLELELEEVDLSSLVSDVANRFGTDLKQVDSELDLRLEPGVQGVWDRLRLEQVVTNLLSNALKYGPGKPIHVKVAKDGDKAVLEVRDEGMGIAPEDLGRIFERFERAVPARNYGGLGLGLYIVRQIIDAFGGEIHVQSTVGEGATFTVELPRYSRVALSRDGDGGARRVH